MRKEALQVCGSISNHLRNPIYVIISIIVFFLSGVSAETLQVSNSTPGIQNAIDAASPGEEILVYPGEYQENLLIDKPITITGISFGSSIPVIVPKTGPNAITVLVDGVSLNALKIRNEEGIANSCIYVESDRNNITNMILTGARNADGGIVLADNKENYIYNCTIINTDEAAISLLNSTRNIISNCTISLCRIGIDVSKSIGNSGEFNNINHCDYGIVHGNRNTRADNPIANTVFHYNYMNEPYNNTIGGP